MDISDANLKFSEEVVLAKYTDEISLDGKWQSLDYYWDNFEPDICNLEKRSAYSNERNLEKQHICFLHSV